ncbi:HopJ type III effector protein [Aurantivibrio infirmus]
MNVKELISQLRNDPDAIEFSQVIKVIDDNYSYTPTTFTNGEVENLAGSNEGSCKIFYFAQLNALSEMETLALFGDYYRQDVLENPAGDDHANIRNFILDGWLGVKFDGEALIEK